MNWNSNIDFSLDYCKCFGNVAGKTIIHCGCGNGDWILEASLQGADKCVGIESDLNLVSMARRSYWELVRDKYLEPALRVEIFQDKSVCFPFKEMFDLGEFDIGIIFPNAHLADFDQVRIILDCIRNISKEVFYYFAKPQDNAIGNYGSEDGAIKFRSRFWQKLIANTDWDHRILVSESAPDWRIFHAWQKQ